MKSPEQMVIERWAKDWTLFAEEAMGLTLDKEQQDILTSIQFNPMTSVVSGTARGKDFIAAVAAVCFLYLVPAADEKGNIESTKVALTAPTERQILNIMMPEIASIYKKLRNNGICPYDAKLLTYAIRTSNENVFLTGFKADDQDTEAWSGFHAVNTMFIVTEASGISEAVFNAIEGNLQGNSRLVLVFNNNTGTGYAANSQMSPRFKSFRLDSLSAPNVLQRRTVIPGQVNHEWVIDKIQSWCTIIDAAQFDATQGDFDFEIEGVKNYYRPNDLFRVKIRGMAPRVAEDVLVPGEWIDEANTRWKNQATTNTDPLRLGVDVAGMGRDSSCFCFRYGNRVEKFDLVQSKGTANHMEISGRIQNLLKTNTDTFRGLIATAFIDTIGEGAGVFSRLQELRNENAYSCKFSQSPTWLGRELKDVTGERTFLNMRAYLYWAIRDWLDPANKTGAALPFDLELKQELTQTKWKYRSDGRIQIEEKEEIKKRLKRSPDKADALANTFFPVESYSVEKKQERLKYRKFLLQAFH